MTGGCFITFEGGEGAGKTTQVRHLGHWLRARGIDVVETREPGGTAGADQIRRLLVTGAVDRWSPLAEALLLFAARVDHVTRRIRPALAAGRWVISDRFADSTLAYQGHALGLGAETVARLADLTLGDFKPDLTLILDVPAEIGLNRARARRGDEDRYERMDPAFHERLRAGFLDIAAGEPERCRVLDGTADADRVHQAVTAAVTERLMVGAS